MVAAMQMQIEAKKAVCLVPSDEALQQFRHESPHLVSGMQQEPEKMQAFLRHHWVADSSFCLRGYPAPIQQLVVMTGNGEPVTCTLEKGDIVSIDGIRYNHQTKRLQGVLAPKKYK